MSFPLYIFLFVYFLFLFGWVVFSLLAIYHMVKFGAVTFATFFSSFVYIAGSAALLFISYNFLSQIEWNMNVSFLEGIFTSGFNF